MRKELTRDEASLHISYDPETGEFRRVSSGHGIKPGQRGGTITSNGYVRVVINKTPVHGHRLAFLMMTGEWPKGVVDHINGKRNDNRWANLRDTTQSVNMQNMRGATRRNRTSGVLGVHWSKQNKKWTAMVMVNGQRKYAGSFDNIESAEAAYAATKSAMQAEVPF